MFMVSPGLACGHVCSGQILITLVGCLSFQLNNHKCLICHNQFVPECQAHYHTGIFYQQILHALWVHFWRSVSWIIIRKYNTALPLIQDWIYRVYLNILKCVLPLLPDTVDTNGQINKGKYTCEMGAQKSCPPCSTAPRIPDSSQKVTLPASAQDVVLGISNLSGTIISDSGVNSTPGKQGSLYRWQCTICMSRWKEYIQTTTHGVMTGAYALLRPMALKYAQLCLELQP